MRPVVSLFLILACLLAGIPAGAQSTVVPVFEPGPCPVDLPAPGGVECGLLTVPEVHAAPDGPTIQIAVAILKSTSSRPQPDPLIFLSGGPGSNTLDSFVGGLGRLEGLLSARDVILIDQRGMGYSMPSLQCAEMTAVNEAPARLPFGAEATAQMGEAVAACSARLQADGVNLAAFNTVESAADVADLIHALGLARADLFGGSYGTTLALSVMRDYPDVLRSVILDTVTPTDVDLTASWGPDAERALDLVFAQCADDPACNANFPNLEAVFYEIVAKLDAAPLTLQVTHPDSGTPVAFSANGSDLIGGIITMLYHPDQIPMIPAAIYSVYLGNVDVLLPAATASLHESTTNGAFVAFRCHDDTLTTTPEAVEAAITAIDPRLQAFFQARYADEVARCDAWAAATPADAFEQAPVTSTIPTLLLSGELDPVTPPAWGAQAAATITPSHAYVVSGIGHGGNAFSSACGSNLTRQFLRSPDEAPDASCLDQIGPVRFYVPG